MGLGLLALLGLGLAAVLIFDDDDDGTPAPASDDTVEGSDGADTLAGDGLDLILGLAGEGHDTLTAGLGNDPAYVDVRTGSVILMDRGGGTDSYGVDYAGTIDPAADFYAPDPATQDASVDILDFDPATEVLTITGFPIDEIDVSNTGMGNSVVLVKDTNGDGFKIFLSGVTVNELSTDNIRADTPFQLVVS